MQKFLHYDTAKEAPDIVSDTRALKEFQRS